MSGFNSLCVMLIFYRKLHEAKFATLLREKRAERDPTVFLKDLRL